MGIALLLAPNSLGNSIKIFAHVPSGLRAGWALRPADSVRRVTYNHIGGERGHTNTERDAGWVHACDHYAPNRDSGINWARAREWRVCPADQMMNDDAPAAAREQPIFARRSLSSYLSISIHLHLIVCVCDNHRESVLMHPPPTDTLSQPIDFYANSNEWKINQPDCCRRRKDAN